MQTLHKTRWRGNRINIELQNRSYIFGGQTASLIIRTSSATADKLGVSKMNRYKVNPDIIETVGGTAVYAKKLLSNAATKIQHRRQTQITRQMPLFGIP